MTNTQKAVMQQALDALVHVWNTTPDDAVVVDNAIATLRKTLAEPVVEPVAWCALSIGGKTIAYFDGKPIIMVGEVGNDCHPHPLYTSPPPPAEVPMTWVKTSEQYPPEGVRVFWFNPQYNQVGYDTWMGSDYKFNAEYWMHIPGIGKAMK